MSCYSSISDFGGNMQSPMSNPLSYCAVSELDSSFTHASNGQLNGPDSSQCQQFMAHYCANDWNGVCEFNSHDNTSWLPNTVKTCDASNGNGSLGNGLGNHLTKGQILIRNTAAEKYLYAMSANCHRVYEPFDPTVANSPLIGKWVTNSNSCTSSNCQGRGICVPVYKVDPKQIDRDPVMNKILAQPHIAMDILVNIYNNARRDGELDSLKGTKLYNLFMQPMFQKIVKSKVYTRI